MTESEELKSLLMKVKEESEKVELEFNIQKTKIMASGRVISWQIDGETVANFSFLGTKITAEDDWNNKVKRYLLLGRKVMANLYNILKSREITLPTMVRVVKAMFFPMVMYGSESWTIKKAEHQRIDAFELCCWRRLLRVRWTAGSKLSILKEISPEYSLERLMLKLKLQYFGLLIEELTDLKRPWYWERLKVGWEGDDRGWDGWMASPTQWTCFWASFRFGDGQESLECYNPWGCKESDTTEWLNWTDPCVDMIYMIRFWTLNWLKNAIKSPLGKL